MRRSVHYEAAFESYLQAKGWPYVAVDEAKKSIFSNVSIKSFDFLVYSTSQPNLLVDVKGRKFSHPWRQGVSKGARAWENWVTAEDLRSLDQWERIFGQGFRSTLVFAYWLQGPVGESPFEDIHFHRGNAYAFLSIPAGQYAAAARTRSAKWQTVAMPARLFSQAARDVGALL